MKLTNKRVVITRPKDKAAEFSRQLRALGAETVLFPTIQILPSSDTTSLDRALKRLHCYDWLVLTSANAVDAVWERLNALSISQLPSTLQVAAVGPKTGATLQARGVTPDFIPQEYVGEAITPGLGDLRGRWVLLPTADIAHDTLPKAIRAEDGIAHVITAYRTVPPAPDPHGLAALRDGVDLIAFTSGSTARNFCALIQQAGLNPQGLPGDPQIACIGPKTAKAARELGLTADIVAEKYTIEGLIQAMCDHATNPNSLTP